MDKTILKELLSEDEETRELVKEIVREVLREERESKENLPVPGIMKNHD